MSVKSLNVFVCQPSGDYRAFIILTGLQGENYYTTQRKIAACQQRSHAQARMLFVKRWDQNRTFVWKEKRCVWRKGKGWISAGSYLWKHEAYFAASELRWATSHLQALCNSLIVMQITWAALKIFSDFSCNKGYLNANSRINHIESSEECHHHMLCAGTYNSFNVSHVMGSQHWLYHEFMFTLFIGVIVKRLQHN